MAWWPGDRCGQPLKTSTIFKLIFRLNPLKQTEPAKFPPAKFPPSHRLQHIGPAVGVAEYHLPVGGGPPSRARRWSCLAVGCGVNLLQTPSPNGTGIGRFSVPLTICSTADRPWCG